MSSYRKEKPETIQAMFKSIAKQYDKTNAALSFQLHKWWNKQLVNEAIKGLVLSSYLDLCCGTGDIAFRYLKKNHFPCQVLLLDFCGEMLECARQKSLYLPIEQQKLLSFIEADAQQLPLADNSISCATMAYGIRNIKDPLQSMREVFRVLESGGRFAILELTQPTNRLLLTMHRLYLRFILPILGRWLTDNEEAYRYLCNSIQTFTSPQKLQAMLAESGFIKTECRPLFGGIATIMTGRKP